VPTKNSDHPARTVLTTGYRKIQSELLSPDVPFKPKMHQGSFLFSAGLHLDQLEEFTALSQTH